MVSRHVHPAVPQAASSTPFVPPAVDYLNMVLRTYSDEIIGDISYRDVVGEENAG